MEIEGFHERINHVACIVFAYPIVQAFWQECQLESIGSFYKTSRYLLPSSDEVILPDSRVFTQPGS